MTSNNTYNQGYKLIHIHTTPITFIYTMTGNDEKKLPEPPKLEPVMHL